MGRDATVTRVVAVEWGEVMRGMVWQLRGLETGITKRPESSRPGRGVVCRVACRGNCGGRLSPANSMLSDHAQQYIISRVPVLLQQQHTLLEL